MLLSDRPLTRRQVVLGLGYAGLAALLAACSSRPTGSASPSASPTPSPSPSPTVEPSATPEPSPSPVPLRQLIAGLLVVGFRGLQVAKIGPIADSISKDGLGGVILFNRDQATGGVRNITSPSQLRALTAGLQALAGDRPLIISIDQEGGQVARLNAADGFSNVASEAAIGAAGDDATATKWGRTIGRTLADMGVTLNFAPVVDLNINPDNPAIGALDRSFSSDPAVVTRLALDEIRAHHEFGVATTLKHFPGLGSASVNTDFGVADVTATWTRTELDPFRDIIASGQADVVMAGHLVNRKLDPDHPASLSPGIVTGLLRGELGWDGVVVTDSLGATAITKAFGQGEAIALAIEAGNDLLLFANQGTYVADLAGRVIDIIEAHVASGRISRQRLEESAARIARLWPG